MRRKLAIPIANPNILINLVWGSLMDIFKIQEIINNLQTDPIYMVCGILIIGIILFYLFKKMIKISIILLIVGISWGVYFYLNEKKPEKIFHDLILDRIDIDDKASPINIKNKLVPRAVTKSAIIARIIPRTKVRECPTFLLNNPAISPINKTAIERIFAI